VCVINNSSSQVQSFNGKVQGVGTSGFGGFAFLVVSRSDGSVKAISKTCTFTLQDRERIKSLKLWYESPATPTIDAAPQTASTAANSSNSKFLKTIEQMVPQTYCDVVCQVQNFVFFQKFMMTNIIHLDC
jgi:hypothetical protein